MASRLTRSALSLAGAAVFAFASVSCTQPQEEPPLAGATIGGDFELIGSDGQTVRFSDYAGKWRTVYFGFTYCPDICPTDVQRTVRGIEMFASEAPERAAMIQPIFVSVDTDRDTPETVGEFAAAFSDDLIGLTGSPEQIAAAAKAFAASYSKNEDAPGGYQHSTVTLLFDPDGNPIATLPTDLGPEAVAEELAKWVR